MRTYGLSTRDLQDNVGLYNGFRRFSFRTGDMQTSLVSGAQVKSIELFGGLTAEGLGRRMRFVSWIYIYIEVYVRRKPL